MKHKQKITTFLWFDNQAEEAAVFYTSTLPDSKILGISRYTESVPGGPVGSVLTVEFQLAGQEFIALNGGPQFQFTQAISLMVNCDTQKEIDQLWEKLSEGGEPNQCGWLKDKFGLSWQITPRVLGEMLLDKDRKKVDRVMKVMMTMHKLEIEPLKLAYEGKESATTRR